MKVLVVGIDSLIGKAVAATLEQHGSEVVGTTRRVVENANTLFLDLEQNEQDWPGFPDDIGVAFIAAAMSRQKDCEDNPEKARFVNVEQTLKLIKKLRACGMHIVYPSTNLVLACDTPKQTVDAPLSPKGLYGKSKAEVETALKHEEDITIVRLPKILDGQSGVLKDWVEKLRSGQEITVFDDMYLAPVSLAYAADFIVTALRKRSGGLWHISGDKEISYLDLAQALIEYLGMGAEKTKQIVIEKAAKTLCAVPRHPGLDCKGTENAWAIKAQPLAEVLYDCCGGRVIDA